MEEGKRELNMRTVYPTRERREHLRMLPKTLLSDATPRRKLRVSWTQLDLSGVASCCFVFALLPFSAPSCQTRVRRRHVLSSCATGANQPTATRPSLHNNQNHHERRARANRGWVGSTFSMSSREKPLAGPHEGKADTSPSYLSPPMRSKKRRSL